MIVGKIYVDPRSGKQWRLKRKNHWPYCFFHLTENGVDMLEDVDCPDYFEQICNNGALINCEATIMRELKTTNNQMQQLNLFAA